MADKEDREKEAGVKGLSRYADDPLNPFECRRVRRTMDVVDVIEQDKVFMATLKTKARAWLLMIGLAAATWTAIITLKGPVVNALRLFGP